MNLYINQTTGNDNFTGLSKTATPEDNEGPICSIEGLKAKLISLRSEQGISSPIVVEFAEGVYPQSETLDLDDPLFSGITFKSEKDAKVAWQGAEKITGWEPCEINGKSAWVVTLPEVKSGDWYFRSLFVNDSRRPRARYPKFDIEKKDWQLLHIGKIHSSGKEVSAMGLHEGDNCFKPKDGDIQNWASLHDAEAVVLHYWIEERMPNLRLDPETGWLHSSHESHFNLREAFNKKLARYYIDNLFEALSEPGEWYLKRTTGELFYIPKKDETIENTEIYAPRILQHVRVKPKAEAYFDKTPIRDIHFSGIHFSMSDWQPMLSPKARHDQPPLQKRPYCSSAQNTTHLPGTLNFQFAQNCSVTQCKITNCGFFGIAAEEGCQDLHFTQNEISQSGGGGIKIHGGDGLDSEWTQTQRIHATDNELNHLGRVFHAAGGVVILHASHNKITHNHVSDLFSTAIACGMIWSYKKNTAHDNLIAYNHIHDYGQKLLSDMGGIYILGVQAGTQVLNNWVHDAQAEDYGAHGIYLDEACSNVVVSHNVVHNCGGHAFTLHKGRDNVVQNNIFATEGNREQTAFDIANEDENTGLFAFRNLILATGNNPNIKGGYGLNIFKTKSIFTSNLYWHEKPNSSIFANVDFHGELHYKDAISLAEWQKTNQDLNSIEENPLIENLREQSMHFDPNSPAIHKIGFVPIDLNQVGPRDEIVEKTEQNYTSTEEMNF